MQIGVCCGRIDDFLDLIGRYVELNFPVKVQVFGKDVGVRNACSGGGRRLVNQRSGC